MKVITRFAPSPTGFLHIGGARTALFNYLFAKHHKGKYLVRIEDTDKERSTSEAVAAIHDSLAWLEIESDDAPISQSARAERHAEVAHQLLEAGHAYRCYLTPEELTELREKGESWTSPWRDSTEPAPDKPFTVRLRMPQSGETTINDAVQGSVSVAHETLDDLVMLRSDGTPTYMLAVVVDDCDMGITHVIRGDDHLNNAFRQQKIIEAMGWEVPIYAHIPLIHGPDGAKLSKRHGALATSAYRDKGFLPEALCNYLLRLGWAHGDEEIISREQAIEWFSLEAIGKSAARFDIEKLTALNSHYIQTLPEEEIISIILKGEKPDYPYIEKRLKLLASAFAERANTILDLEKNKSFITVNYLPYIHKDAEDLLDKTALSRLSALAEALPDRDFTSHEATQIWFKEWLEKSNLKMRDIGPILRAALTGSTQSPDIILIAYALGVNTTRSRIKKVCKREEKEYNTPRPT